MTELVRERRGRLLQGVLIALVVEGAALSLTAIAYSI